jgi:hypothetical protein
MWLKTFFHHSTIPSMRISLLLCAILFALCVSAHAQQAAKG